MSGRFFREEKVGKKRCQEDFSEALPRENPRTPYQCLDAQCVPGAMLSACRSMEMRRAPLIHLPVSVLSGVVGWHAHAAFAWACLHQSHARRVPLEDLAPSLVHYGANLKKRPYLAP